MGSLQFFIDKFCKDLFFEIPWEIFSDTFLSMERLYKDIFVIFFEENMFFPIDANILFID